MLDLLPRSWDAGLSRLCSPVSRWVSIAAGGEAKPVCAQVGPRWALLIGRRHCEDSRKAWK